jgi:5-methylcytosine-specific restriction endonuclease McrA
LALLKWCGYTISATPSLMAQRPKISAALRRRIAGLDGQRCAYCRSLMVVGVPMVSAHIMPLVAGGTSAAENLCRSCYHCNEFTGPRQDAPDPHDDQIVPLFHPRQQQWHEHFAWRNDLVTVSGLTPSRPPTIDLLHLNNDWIVQARRIWILSGLQPPLE